MDWWEQHKDNIESFLWYVEKTWIGRGKGPNRRESMFQGCFGKYKDVLADKQLTNNAVESFNATRTDGMERRPSLYSVLDRF